MSQFSGKQFKGAMRARRTEKRNAARSRTLTQLKTELVTVQRRNATEQLLQDIFTGTIEFEEVE
jgi:hypothetical protein